MEGGGGGGGAAHPLRSRMRDTRFRATDTSRQMDGNSDLMPGGWAERVSAGIQKDWERVPQPRANGRVGPRFVAQEGGLLSEGNFPRASINISGHFTVSSRKRETHFRMQRCEPFSPLLLGSGRPTRRAQLIGREIQVLKSRVALKRAHQR